MMAAERHPNGGLSLSELARGGPPSDAPPNPLQALQEHNSVVPIPPPPPTRSGSGVSAPPPPPPLPSNAPPPFIQGVQPLAPLIGAPPNTPNWMDVSSASQPKKQRTGVAAAPRSGLHTILFFAAITIGVGAAGILGVTVWGPDKNPENRSHFASDPPPPTVLPSLPPEEASAAPTPTASDTPPADDTAKGGKKKGGRKGGKNRR